MDRSEIISACRVLAEKMLEAEEEEKANEHKERQHRMQKEAARLKKENLKSIILELMPDYATAPQIRALIMTEKSSEADGDSAHKLGKEGGLQRSSYGKWTGVAKRALELAGGAGTYQELREVVIKNNIIPSDNEEVDLAPMRNALHGLRRRNAVTYEAADDGGGGVFKLIKHESDKKQNP